MDIDTATNPAALQIPNGRDGVEAIATLATKNLLPDLRLIDVDDFGVPEGIVCYAHPQTGEIRIINDKIEALRQRPRAARGTAQVTTLESFCALTNRHKTPHSVIFAHSDLTAPALTAIIDYHGTNGTPDNGRHRVNYTFPITNEFAAWRDSDGKPLSQSDFALFLEDHAAEIASPTADERKMLEPLFRERLAEPNEMLDLSRGLEVNVSSRVKNVVRPATGERQIVFVEEQTNASGERVDVPGAFMVCVPAFVGGDPMRMVVRLRMRVSNGSIIWAYNIWRLDDTLRQRMEQDAKQAENDTSLPVYFGQPEMRAG